MDEEALIVDNPMIMFLKLLQDAEPAEIALAGFDGYVKAEQPNYVNPNMEHTFSREKAKEINEDAIRSLKKLKSKQPICFVTDSLYNH